MLFTAMSFKHNSLNAEQKQMQLRLTPSYFIELTKTLQQSNKTTKQNTIQVNGIELI